ncbi:conjugation system SOS inhibitor PsiB family protein [Candidatus Pantoea formicae]|uniref:conjugation system SOS inhibitor PsiB family protein n=1 Tax=Candidatus Pantoea formicae TaxID=2608355 RepID=UPI003ED9DFAA
MKGMTMFCGKTEMPVPRSKIPCQQANQLLLSTLGGEMRRHDEDIICDKTYTLAWLQEFSPLDFESYCARGEDFRRHLSRTVLQILELNNVWQTGYENKEEWGGVFPVHLRLRHRKCKHVTIDIMSPGSESPFWHGLMWLNPDHTGLYFWNSDMLATEAICSLLQRISEFVRNGHTPGDIAGVLRRGGVT